MDLLSVTATNRQQLLRSPVRTTNELDLTQPLSVLSPATQLSQLALKTPTKPHTRHLALDRPPIVASLPALPYLPEASPSKRLTHMHFENNDASRRVTRSARRITDTGLRSPRAVTPTNRLIGRAKTEPRIHGRVEKHHHPDLNVLLDTSACKSSASLFASQDDPLSTPTHRPSHHIDPFDLGQENVRPNFKDTTPRILFKSAIQDRLLATTGKGKGVMTTRYPRTPLQDVTVHYKTKNEVRHEQETAPDGKLVETVKSIQTTVKVTTFTTITEPPTPQQKQPEQLEEATWQIWEDSPDNEDELHTPPAIMAEDFEHDNQENVFVLPPNETPIYKKAKRHAGDDISAPADDDDENDCPVQPRRHNDHRVPLGEIDVRTLPEYKDAFADQDMVPGTPKNLTRLYKSIIARPDGTLPASLQEDQATHPHGISVNMLLSPSKGGTPSRGRMRTRKSTKLVDLAESLSHQKHPASNCGIDDEENVFLVHTSPPTKRKAVELDEPTRENAAFICREEVTIPHKKEWDFDVFEDPEEEGEAATGLDEQQDERGAATGRDEQQENHDEDTAAGRDEQQEEDDDDDDDDDGGGGGGDALTIPPGSILHGRSPSSATRSVMGKQPAHPLGPAAVIEDCVWRTPRTPSKSPPTPSKPPRTRSKSPRMIIYDPAAAEALVFDHGSVARHHRHHREEEDEVVHTTVDDDDITAFWKSAEERYPEEEEEEEHSRARDELVACYESVGRRGRCGKRRTRGDGMS